MSQINLEADNSEPKKLIKDKDLIAWQCAGTAPLIRNAKVDRFWMESNEGFAYRCLPLVIANQLGWDVINPVTFAAFWNGGNQPSDVTIRWPNNINSNLPQTHFGLGILTFTLGHLFQTSPGVNLLVTGPFNSPKDGISPLTGIVETDWSPATFTMNWRFTRPNFEVVFEAGEPYCRIFPYPRYETERVHPIIRMISDNPELEKSHSLWREKRDEFNKGLKIPDSSYVKRKWQRDYFKGGGDLWPQFSDHQTKLNQSEFKDTRPDNIRLTDQIPKLDLKPYRIRLSNGSMTIFLPSLGFSDDFKPTGANPNPVGTIRYETPKGIYRAANTTDSKKS